MEHGYTGRPTGRRRHAGYHPYKRLGATSGGNGPVSDGILFELLWQVYRAYGAPSLLIKNLPALRWYIDYLDTRADEDGFVSFSLDDWASPERFEGNKTPL